MSYANESPEEREARWHRLRTMSDAEIEANIASDPDSQVPIEALHQGYWLDPDVKHLVRPDGSARVAVDLDASTARWLETHPIDYQAFLSGVLKAYVASQRKGC